MEGVQETCKRVEDEIFDDNFGRNWALCIQMMMTQAAPGNRTDRRGTVENLAGKKTFGSKNWDHCYVTGGELWK